MFNRTKIALAYLIACVFVFPIAKSSAEEGVSWLGKRVMPKKPYTELKITDQHDRVVTVGTLKGSDYIVQKENGPWIQVVDGGVEGWFLKKDAVLVQDGPAHFTQPIPTRRWRGRAFERPYWKPTQDKYSGRRIIPPMI
jgi:hypothetical protein